MPVKAFLSPFILFACDYVQQRTKDIFSNRYGPFSSEAGGCMCRELFARHAVESCGEVDDESRS